MNRRDFLKGFSALALDALLARRHGVLIPGREQLVQWGKENGVLRPQWDGVGFAANRIIHGVRGTLYIKIGDLFCGHQEWLVNIDGSYIMIPLNDSTGLDKKTKALSPFVRF
jgi:hypothetical protein